MLIAVLEMINVQAGGDSIIGSSAGSMYLAQFTRSNTAIVNYPSLSGEPAAAAKAALSAGSEAKAV